jgi:hypothetical protein
VVAECAGHSTLGAVQVCKPLWALKHVLVCKPRNGAGIECYRKRGEAVLSAESIHTMLSK